MLHTGQLSAKLLRMDKDLRYKLNTLKIYYKHNYKLPTLSEALSVFGKKSRRSCEIIYGKLVKAGYVRVIGRDHVPTKPFFDFPILGSARAGVPTEEYEDGNPAFLWEHIVRRPDSTLIIRAKGDSMIDAGIHDEDLVVVERTQYANSGDIVLARVDSKETIKFYVDDGVRKFLRPANNEYKDITEFQTLEIVGVVNALVHKFNS
jgi:SOS-response transcriptional repressor LexA